MLGKRKARLANRILESKMTISQGQLKVYETDDDSAQADTSSRAKESRKGRMADALALTGDEGRDKLRKAAGRCK